MAQKKLGRPVNSPKVFMLRVKMDMESLEKLDECCKITGQNRSEFVRDNIQQRHTLTKFAAGFRLGAKLMLDTFLYH